MIQRDLFKAVSARLCWLDVEYFHVRQAVLRIEIRSAVLVPVEIIASLCAEHDNRELLYGIGVAPEIFAFLNPIEIQGAV